MLKGHAKIELTDVNTGKVEMYEHDNLVTNAVAKLLNDGVRFAGHSTLNTYDLPFYNRAMGGILLFQNPLEENVNNVRIPAESENPMVGYASIDTNATTDTKRGSRNLTESELTENGYKFVWDFTTSQANGQISALALTSCFAGSKPFYTRNIPYWWRSQSSSGNGIVATTRKFDFDNWIGTSVRVSSTTTVTITKWRIKITEIGIDDKLLGVENLEEQVIDFSASGITLNTASVCIYGGGYIYIVHSNDSYVLNVARINEETLTIDEEYGLKSISTKIDGINHWLRINTTYPAVVYRDGYLYCAIYASPYGFLKINVNDIGDISFIATSLKNGVWYTKALTLWGNDIACPGAFIHSDDSVEQCNILTLSNEAITIETSIHYNFSYNSSGAQNRAFCMDDLGRFMEYVYNEGYSDKLYYLTIGHIHNYLATINNLETPVTKTAAQTMKITYTLTEVSG